MTETSFQFNWEQEPTIFRMVTSKQRFCTQNKTKKTKKVSRKFYFRTAIKFTHSLALTRKVEREGGSFVSQQTQNFFKKDFYPTQRVRQSCPIHSANCTFRHILRLFRLFRGDRSGMDKSSSATCLLYSDVVKVDPSPTWLRKYQEEDEEEAVKRAIKESEIFVS